MPETTRRNFMALAGCAALAGIAPLGSAGAMPLGLSPGLQLWAVRDDLARDFAGTLRAQQAMGDVATTARVMGCSEGAVKTHLSRARDALQRHLEPWQ